MAAKKGKRMIKDIRKKYSLLVVHVRHLHVEAVHGCEHIGGALQQSHGTYLRWLNSEIGAHVRMYLCYLICLRHLEGSIAVTYRKFFL